MSGQNNDGLIPSFIIHEIIALHFPNAAFEDIGILPPFNGIYYLFEYSAVSTIDLKILKIQKINAKAIHVLTIINIPPVVRRELTKYAVIYGDRVTLLEKIVSRL